MAVVLMAAALFGAPAHAQDATADDAAAFLVTVGEASRGAQERIDSTFETSAGECVGLAEEACLQRFLAPDLGATADEIEAFAALLESTDVPERFADDVATHVGALRATVESLGAGVDAALAADRLALDEAAVAQAGIYTELIAELDPAYAAAAFVSALGGREDWLDRAAGLAPTDREYLADLRDARLAAGPNFDCFTSAIDRTYGDTTSLLSALSECGAGESLALIEAAMRQLEPTPRFAREHAFWLGAMADSVPFDRMIGEAAEAGDVVSFLVNNARMGRAQRLESWLDPAFVDAISQGAAHRPLRSSEPLAETIYGQELHAAVTAYSIDDPFSMLITTLDFPQVPREEAFPAIAELAAEARESDAALFAALEAVAPPDEFADDHAALLAFFADYSRGVEGMIEAAATGDEAATFAIQNAAEQVFCDVEASFSDTIRPAVEPFFGIAPQHCL